MFVHSDMSSPSSSSSSSTSSSPIHHASLVDPATHNPALLELIDVKVSRQVIEYVVDRVVETVDYAMGRPTPSSSKSSSRSHTSSRGRAAIRRPENAKFTTFVSNVLTRAEVTMPTLLATLVYIDRARPHLHIGLEQWALERVFLGALIVASKYLNDSTLKNVHWALCTGVFGKRDVGRIEREYLDVLNFELKITEDDLLSHHEGLAEVLSYLTLSPRYVAAMEIEVEQEMEMESVHRHTERRHTSTRRRTVAPVPVPTVPELSPSSGESSPNSDSSSFYSPRTPSDASMDTSPEDLKDASSRRSHHKHDSQHQLPPTQPGTARKMINAVTQSSTMDMLRLFPIPRMTTA